MDFSCFAWALMLLLVFRNTQADAVIYFMVTAVFLTISVSHQNFLVAYFPFFNWSLLLLLLLLVWLNRQVFLSPQNKALPVWLISALVAMVFLILKHFEISFLRSLPMYFLWACVQQILIGPVFSERLRHHLKLSKLLTACVVGVLFSIIHTPNHMLMLATLLGGTAWSYAWLRYENIYANAFSHALLALVFYQLMPEDWLGSARIGVFF